MLGVEGGALCVGDGEGRPEAGALGNEHGLACLGGDAAAAVDFEQDAAFHDADPLVVVQGEPGLGRRGFGDTG